MALNSYIWILVYAMEGLSGDNHIVIQQATGQPPAELQSYETRENCEQHLTNFINLGYNLKNDNHANMYAVFPKDSMPPAYKVPATAVCLKIKL